MVSIERGEVAARSPNPVFYDVAFVERIRRNAYEQEQQLLKPFETWWLADIQLHASNGVIIIDDKKLLLESMLKPVEAKEAAYYRHYIPNIRFGFRGLVQLSAPHLATITGIGLPTRWPDSTLSHSFNTKRR